MEREYLLNQLKNHIYCRLKPSKFGGVGVFAIRKIPAGAEPFFGSAQPKHIFFSVEQLADLHPNVKRLVQDIVVFKNGVYHLPDNGLAQINIAYYVNHSDSPNLKVREDGHTFEAVEDILEGEELTADYSTYNDKEDVFDR